MKKIILPLIILFSVVACGKAEKPYRVGLVNFTSGSVTVIGAKGLEMPAKIGMPLDNGMRVKTSGEKSACEIYFNETAVKVFGDSNVSVEWITHNMKRDADETVLSLEKGICFANVKHKLMKDDTFIVKTPTCVAAVRGTKFFVSGDNKTANVSCLDGKVEVRGKNSKNQPKTVEDRQEVSASAGKTASVKPIAEKRAKDLESKSEVKPLTEKNRETFDKLDARDSGAIRSIKKNVSSISGSVPEKDSEKKSDSDVDIFFFKR
jgi:hypothetical protein